MKRATALSRVVLLAILTGFHGPLSEAVVVDMVFVGDPDNPSNPKYVDDSDGLGRQNLGSVDYVYYIGKYAVTNQQYAAFLNSVNDIDIWNHDMQINGQGGIWRDTSSWPTYKIKSGFDDKPVFFVSLENAARFCNWMTSQLLYPDTETKMYDLTDPTKLANEGLTRNHTAWRAGGVAIANEDEWCKAAYYDPSPSGPASGYWEYATRSNDPPNAVEPNDEDPNSANWFRVIQIGSLTDGGSYSLAHSYYGTFDQAGNAAEMMENVYPSAPAKVIYRGGDYNTTTPTNLSYSYRELVPISYRYGRYGFRVVSLHTIGGEKLNWGPYPMHDGIADTGDWLGLVDVTHDPWVYSHLLELYLYIPEESLSDPDGAWIYIP